MQRYESYKSSGLAWLGEVPSHWGLKKSKFLWREREDRSLLGDEQLLSVSQYSGVVPRVEDSRSDSLEDYKRCEPNDLVINIMLAWMSGLGVSKYSGIVSPAYCVYSQLENHNPSYFDYLYRTPQYLAEFARRSKGIVPSRWRMYTEDFGQILSLLPPREEQDRIVAFLDQKTAEIDAAIAKKERLIELLEEQRHTLISRAVTYGLNPDVALQENNCKWLGTTPLHWKIQKIKYCSKIFRGKFTHRPRNDPRLYDGPYPFIQTGDVARAGKFITEFKQTLNERGLRVSTLIPKGTVVLTIAANVGDISILGFDACFPDSVVGFLPDSELERDYFYLALSVMKRQFMVSSIQNTQMNLNVDRIGSNSIAIPPLPEQRAIIKWADEITGFSEAAKTKLTDEICALRELKSTLVANVVTGNLKI